MRLRGCAALNLRHKGAARPKNCDQATHHEVLRPVTVLFSTPNVIIFCHRHAGAPPAAPGPSRGPTPDGAEATEESHVRLPQLSNAQRARRGPHGRCHRRGPSRLHDPGLQPDGAWPAHHGPGRRRHHHDGHDHQSGRRRRHAPQWRDADLLRLRHLRFAAALGGDPCAAGRGVFPVVPRAVHERVGRADDLLGLCRPRRPVIVLDLPGLHHGLDLADLLRNGRRLRRAVAVRLHHQARPDGDGLVPHHGRVRPDHRDGHQHLPAIVGAVLRRVGDRRADLRRPHRLRHAEDQGDVLRRRRPAGRRPQVDHCSCSCCSSWATAAERGLDQKILKGGPTAALFFYERLCCNDVHKMELHKL